MNRNTVLFGLLVVLLVVAYLVLQKPGEQSLSSEGIGKLVDVDSLAVDKIEIKTGTLDLLLEKKGIEWSLQRPVAYRADQTVVANVIHQAKDLEIKGSVSSNPEKHSLFNVDSAGAQVRIYEKGAEKASFVVGKATSSFSETYVRKMSSNDVAIAAGSFGYVFNRALREWRDKTIANVPTETIKEIRFQYGDTTFVLALKDSVWMIGRDSTQQTAVEDLIRGLSNVTADDFIDTTLSPRPKISAQVSYAGIQLRFSFSKTAGKYYVQSSSSPQWFVMETWKTTPLLKRKKELVKSGV